jgi:hypothetical protein
MKKMMQQMLQIDPRDIRLLTALITVITGEYSPAILTGYQCLLVFFWSFGHLVNSFYSGFLNISTSMQAVEYKLLPQS